MPPVRVQRGSQPHQEHQQDPAEPPRQHAETQLHLRPQARPPTSTCGGEERHSDGLQRGGGRDRHLPPLLWSSPGPRSGQLSHQPGASPSSPSPTSSSHAQAGPADLLPPPHPAGPPVRLDAQHHRQDPLQLRLQPAVGQPAPPPAGLSQPLAVSETLPGKM